MPIACTKTTYLLIPQDFPKPEAPSGGAAPAGGGTPGVKQDANPQGGGGAVDTGGSSTMFLIMAVVIAFVLFSSMRRESKAKKEHAAMLSAIKQGDTVVTTSGIHAVVHRIDNQTVTLILDTAKVTFDRAAIARVVRDQAAAKTA